MKKALLTAIIILFTSGVYAQIGMPKELTCTERAFNFSFSLGTKWKIGAPRMGPAEVTKEVPDYFTAWSLKYNEATPQTHLFSLMEMPFYTGALSYPINRQNYAALSYQNSFIVTDKPRYLLPGLNFSPSITPTILKPDFLINSNSRNQ